MASGMEKRNTMDRELINSALKLLAALPAVILLACVSLRLTGRYLHRQNPSGGIQILEKVPVSNKSALYVVKLFDEVVVLGISENNIQRIRTLSPEEAKAYLEKKAGKDPGRNREQKVQGWFHNEKWKKVWDKYGK
jgi:flagellar biogenesis protein FliO